MKTTQKITETNQDSCKLIISPGIDIVEIDRIRKAAQRQGKAFLARLFTPSEQSYCERYQDPYPSYAARFAGKEAVAKCLKVGIGKSLSWLDMEITHAEGGSPIITLSSKAKKAFGNPHITLSLSHSKTLATAIAIRSA